MLNCLKRHAFVAHAQIYVSLSSNSTNNGMKLFYIVFWTHIANNLYKLEGVYEFFVLKLLKIRFIRQ